MSLQPQSVLQERYRLIKPLGKGGSGQTWLVEDMQGHQFALKTLHLGQIETWKSIDMFERQFTLLKTLAHPGPPSVVEIFDAEVGGVMRRFLVQEHIEGQTLQQAMRDGKRHTEATARVLLDKLLNIVAYLHGFSPPILHRDIKPDNIMLREGSGDPVLIDFDAARGDSVDHRTADGTMVGTAGFVPMEQLAGRPTQASDLYALGMTMVTVLTGEDPINLPTENMRVQFEDRVNLSPGFCQVLADMIEPDVNHRIPTVETLRQRLEKPAPKSKKPNAKKPKARKAKKPIKNGTMRMLSLKSMEARGWRKDLKLWWASEAKASSTWGWGWTSKEATGPPKVYPKYSDRAGAWASKGQGEVAWLELTFPPCVARAKAVNIFQNYNPGAIYKVEVATPGHTLEVVWAGEAKAIAAKATVMEVDLHPPRKVHKVRLSLDGSKTSSWSEIDAVALVCTDIVQLQAPQNTTRGLARWRWALWFLLPLALIAPLFAAIALVTVSTSSNIAERTPPSAPVVAKGAKIDLWTAKDLHQAPMVWAGEVKDVSSQYKQDSWSARQALHAPNVYPKHGDNTAAWASKPSNDTFEWIEVSLPKTTPTSQIVIVETFHPGAIVRIDDTSGPEAVIIWRGESPTSAQAQILHITLPKQRNLRSLRVVLDTRKVNGWNEIDAIGVAP